MDIFGDLNEIMDGNTSGITSSDLAEIQAQARESEQHTMSAFSKLAIGLVGIAICVFLIKIVLKKMNKSKR